MKNRVVLIGFLAFLVITAADLPVSATRKGPHHFIGLAERTRAWCYSGQRGAEFRSVFYTGGNDNE